MDVHEPKVIPLVDVADRWVVHCGCGCGLSEEYARRHAAEDRAAEIRAADGSPGERAEAAAAADTEGVERI